MRILTLLALAALSGCVTASPLVLPNGHQGQLIRCGGAYLEMTDCVAKAGELCPAGFDIVGADRSSQPFLLASNGTLMGGTIERRSLIVSCR